MDLFAIHSLFILKAQEPKFLRLSSFYLLLYNQYLSKPSPREITCSFMLAEELW